MTHRRSFTDLSPQLAAVNLKQITGSTPPVIALASGNNDLYTVPTGRRVIALFTTAYNSNVGAVTFYPTLKVGATTYRVGTSAVPGSGAQGNVSWQMAFEAGDVIGVNASATGLNLSAMLIEFASSSPLVSARVLDTINGDNTLYTCPANKKAYLFNSALTYGVGVISFCGTTGTPNLTPYLVPSGSSKGATNQIAPATAVSANTRGSINCSAVLAAGDSIVVAADAAGAILIASIQELPA